MIHLNSFHLLTLNSEDRRSPPISNFSFCSHDTESLAAARRARSI